MWVRAARSRVSEANHEVTRSALDGAEVTHTLPSKVGEAKHTTISLRKVSSVAEKLLTLAEVADLLSVPVGTLYSWRHRGEGPRGYKMGRHVRYSRASVESWLSGCLEVEGRRGLD